MLRGSSASLRTCIKNVSLVKDGSAKLVSTPLVRLFRISSRNGGAISTNHALFLSTCANCSRWFYVKSLINRNFLILGTLFTKQCEFVAAQRLRRAYQIWCLHSQLYSEKAFESMAKRLSRRLIKQKKPLGMLLGAALFNWEKEQITDDEMEKCACGFLEIESVFGKFSSSPSLKSVNCDPLNCSNELSSWELIINKDHLKVWRKPVKKSNLYEYKVFGTFFDIPARAFFRVQVDTDYRKKWDSLVIKLDVIDRLRNSKKKSVSEVVHWVMHYPYPMYSRDYVYVRRYMIDNDKKLMMILSRSTDHPAAPLDKNYVRVTAYRSQMVIRPHISFDENGMDYVLTYFDDPQAMFPSPAYNWMASSDPLKLSPNQINIGVPDFVKKLHSAAKNSMHEEGSAVAKPASEVGSFSRSKWKTLHHIFA